MLCIVTRAATISYVWSLPQVTKKMMFTLTTAYSENAQIQVMASTAVINDKLIVIGQFRTLVLVHSTRH